MSERGIGDNSGEKIGGIAAEALQQYIDRIENLESEKAALQADIKAVFDESKAAGFDGKAIRRIIRERKREKEALREEQETYELYCRAVSWDIFA